MAPGTRRANRGGYVEHDDFEGLPVRQWRHVWASAEPPPPPETTQKNDKWSQGPRWGMPRDTGLLPQHSQDLLRAARSGQLYKRPAPTEDEDVDADAVLERLDKKDDDKDDKGFQVKVWKQVNRNSEGASISYLAKRRKGAVTISSKTLSAQPSGATVTRATVRRVDAAGNPYTQEVTLHAGQAVEGEILSTTIVPAAALGDQGQPTPPRNRRPPPPKKHKKLGGPGRGRKKKMVQVSEAVPGQDGAQNAEGTGAVGASKPEGTPSVEAGIKREDSNNPDSEMADNDDDDDDGDDDDEGEGDETKGNAEGQDQEMTDAAPAAAEEAEKATPTPNPTTAPGTAEMPAVEHLQNPALVNPSLQVTSPRLEGSPLKNVITTDAAPATAASSTLIQSEESSVLKPDTGDAPAITTVKTTTEIEAPLSPFKQVEEQVEITPSSTFIPPPDRVGNIASPEATPDVAMSEAMPSAAGSEAGVAKEGSVAASVQIEETPRDTPLDEKRSEPTVEEIAETEKTKQEDSPALQPAVIEEPKVSPSSEAPVDKPAEPTEKAVAEEQLEEAAGEPAGDKAPSAEAEPALAEAAEATASVAVPSDGTPAATATTATAEGGPDLLATLEASLEKQEGPEKQATPPALPTEESPAQPPVTGDGSIQDQEVEEKSVSLNDEQSTSAEPAAEPAAEPIGDHLPEKEVAAPTENEGADKGPGAEGESEAAGASSADPAKEEPAQGASPKASEAAS